MKEQTDKTTIESDESKLYDLKLLKATIKLEDNRESALINNNLSHSN